MSQTFPRDKDHIIDEMDEHYGLELTDEQARDLRVMTAQQLFLVTILISKAVRIAKESMREID